MQERMYRWVIGVSIWQEARFGRTGKENDSVDHYDSQYKPERMMFFWIEEICLRRLRFKYWSDLSNRMILVTWRCRSQVVLFSIDSRLSSSVLRSNQLFFFFISFCTLAYRTHTLSEKTREHWLTWERSFGSRLLVDVWRTVLFSTFCPTEYHRWSNVCIVRFQKIIQPSVISATTDHRASSLAFRWPSFLHHSLSIRTWWDNSQLCHSEIETSPKSSLYFTTILGLL